MSSVGKISVFARHWVYIIDYIFKYK